MTPDSVLKKYSKLVEPAIADLLISYVDKKNQRIVKYQIFTGGKRLRPALALISCQLAGGNIKPAIYPAAGLEILHNYSLIVDDIIDNSTLRRNKLTAWAKYGSVIAQCIAVDYSSAIFQSAKESKNPTDISELFAKTLKAIVDGEIADILFERAGRNNEPYILKNRYKNITEADYFKMVGKKTASLFAASCECGAIVAGATPKQIASLGNFGFNLGVAFQIQDDILDVFGKTKSFGKQVGKDIMERKGGNIVILYALKEMTPAERQKVLSIMKKDEVSNDDVSSIMKLVVKTEALQKSYQLEKKYIDKAKATLKLLPKNKWNDILNEIADYLLVRKK